MWRQETLVKNGEHSPKEKQREAMQAEKDVKKWGALPKREAKRSNGDRKKKSGEHPPKEKQYRQKMLLKNEEHSPKEQQCRQEKLL